MKRVAFFALALVIPALVLCVPPAAAVDGGYWNRLGPYTTFKAGIFSPQASDIDNFDTSFYGEIAFGGRPHPAFATELAVGWTRPEHDVLGGKERLTIVPVMLNAKIPIPLGPVNPYVMGGIGGYWTQLKTPLLGKDDDWTLGFQAGAGIDFNITPLMYVGAEAKYMWAKPTFFGVDRKIDGYTVTGNLGFRF